MDECLAYFRAAVHAPLTVPPWSAWWAANADVVERTFPLFDFVRLKHRRLRGARQILQNRGELPTDFVPQSLRITMSCSECGERTETVDGTVNCPNCGMICTFPTAELPGFLPSPLGGEG
ncbi:MAG: hypothetical protein ACRC7O_01525 [Fimbriiglobus sp.]